MDNHTNTYTHTHIHRHTLVLTDTHLLHTHAYRHVCLYKTKHTQSETHRSGREHLCIQSKHSPIQSHRAMYVFPLVLNTTPHRSTQKDIALEATNVRIPEREVKTETVSTTQAFGSHL